LAYIGRYAEALLYQDAALAAIAEVGWTAMRAGGMRDRAKIYYALGDRVRTLECLEVSEADDRRIQNRDGVANARTMRARIAADAGDVERALALFGESLSEQRALDEPAETCRTEALIATQLVAKGDREAARTLIEGVVRKLDEGLSTTGLYYPAEPRWLCYQVLAGLGDPRAAAALEQAYQFLHELAAREPDPGERQSFLSAVPLHRAICAAWATQGPLRETIAE
jgi:tetratricopeptide (TPR) repeat protein